MIFLNGSRKGKNCQFRIYREGDGNYRQILNKINQNRKYPFSTFPPIRRVLREPKIALRDSTDLLGLINMFLTQMDLAISKFYSILNLKATFGPKCNGQVVIAKL